MGTAYLELVRLLLMTCNFTASIHLEHLSWHHARVASSCSDACVACRGGVAQPEPDMVRSHTMGLR